jgi:hypothetical protein
MIFAIFTVNLTDMKKLIIPILMAVLAIAACSSEKAETALKTGAERTGEYLPLLDGKKVAVVANQTSMVGTSHLVDTLLSSGIDVKMIFAPEHGFRDLADADAVITSGADPVTGINVVSLYGAKKSLHRKTLPELILSSSTSRMWGQGFTHTSPPCAMLWRHAPKRKTLHSHGPPQSERILC